ncbi:MAG: hypothetical protein HYZ81_18940, partial [Nitrospinae bacterium]|nr:hypothetical protein [Nitrospinota bacterium]
KIAEKTLPWLETVYVELVPEGQAEPFIDRMIQGGAKVIFTTSFGYMDYWWLLAEGAVTLGGKAGLPINPAYEAKLKAVKVKGDREGETSIYDLVLKRLDQMAKPEPTVDPFQGPIYDRKGTLRVPAGRRMTQQELISMEWAARGIVGPWSNEP